MKTTLEKLATHPTASRAQWLKARVELLKAEKDLTHRSDELTRKRQALPWVRIDKEYRFDTDKGPATLQDLFRGRSQLMVYHFMFGPDYKAGCPSCSSIADSFNGVFTHLQNHDVMFWAVSRAPLAKLQTYKKRMGWSFPWASSFSSDFNHDFNVHFTEEEQQKNDIDYNYSTSGVVSSDNKIRESKAAPEAAEKNPGEALAASTGTDWPTYIRETPGMSVFALEAGHVYHTYSAYARGLDVLWNLYQWLDRAPRGRNEEGFWIRRHDEYGKA